MTDVLPAIIANNLKELEEKIKLVEPYVKWAHIDVMDGKFTPQTSWPYSEGAIADLSKLKTNLHLEIHLMIEKPEQTIDTWLVSPAQRFLIHYESTHEIHGCIHKINEARKDVGIALKLETPVMVVNDLLGAPRRALGVVQLMGIASIGAHGFPFDERVLEKIKILHEKHPSVTIEVDGGINLESAKKAMRAGATRLVSGNHIFKSQNIEEATQQLERLVP